MKTIARIPGTAVAVAVLAAGVGAHRLPAGGEEPVYAELPGPGKTCRIGEEYTFTYEFDKTPKMGMIVVKIKLFDKSGARTTELGITGRSDMPSMARRPRFGRRRLQAEQEGRLPPARERRHARGMGGPARLFDGGGRRLPGAASNSMSKRALASSWACCSPAPREPSAQSHLLYFELQGVAGYSTAEKKSIYHSLSADDIMQKTEHRVRLCPEAFREVPGCRDPGRPGPAGLRSRRHAAPRVPDLQRLFEVQGRFRRPVGRAQPARPGAILFL